MDSSYPPANTQPRPDASAPLKSGKLALDPATDSDDDGDYDREMNLANNALNGRRGKEASPLRSLTPKRIALIAAFLLFVVFWFGKGTGSRSSVTGTDVEVVDEAKETDVAPEAVEIPVEKLPSKSPQKNKAKPGSKKCTPPPGKKAKSYALMIDAGSTGSRLHLYTFSHCDPAPDALPKLEDEGFFTTKPGLSDYRGSPVEAAESLRGLMDHAMEGVPADMRRCTPIAVKATAGLRLLGEEESSAILKAVETWLENSWPFKLVQDGVTVMDGRDEGKSRAGAGAGAGTSADPLLPGVYAWITINFVRPSS